MPANNIISENSRYPKVLKLHLELDLGYADDDDIEVLKKRNDMETAISRDILAPSEMTLHALHYAIQRAFGWQNRHLHKFTLPRELFNKVTSDSAARWMTLAGVYFRFPSEDYPDIYWDDDYKDGQSIKTWLRKKYTGPFRYKGIGEHYIPCQIKVRRMQKEWPMITVHEFEKIGGRRPKPYDVPLKDAAMHQLNCAFMDGTYDELLERLTLSQIINAPGRAPASDEDLRAFLDSVSEITIDKEVGKVMKEGFSSQRKMTEFMNNYDPAVLPLTSELQYDYDYGEDWKVRISCTGSYDEADGVWTGSDGSNETALGEALANVAEKRRPVCIAKDGHEVLDDVGGIMGYCDMLRRLAAREPDDQEWDDIIEWAYSMGWDGREISAERTL